MRFNVRENTVQTYRQQGDLEVIEFSDGAFFKDQQTGTLFFGGTNGFITISENDQLSEEYMPPLHFNRLSIFGKECNIYDFLQGATKQKLWCWTIVRTSLTFHLLLSITLTGTIILLL